jgi:hypothetical protein
MSTWLPFLVLLAMVNGQQNIDTHTFVINSKTGMMYPPTIPVFVKPGDHLLLCAPPGLSSACYMMTNQTCLTLRNACVGKTIGDHYPSGASVLFQSNAPHLYINKLQPWPDPLAHCLILFGKHKTLFSDCVETLLKYSNNTVVLDKLDIGPAYNSLSLSTIVQIQSQERVAESEKVFFIMAQVVFFLLTIPLFLMTSSITCTN